MKQTIVFFGSGAYTVPVVEKLAKHNLSLVVSTESNGPLALFCNVNSIPYITTDKPTAEVIKDHSSNSKSSTVNGQLSNVNSPTVAVLASYGAFIPDEIINIFPKGIINIHPSLLPKYKGPSPIQYTLLNGATQTGVTLIKLDNEIDHGPILSQRPYNLQGNETTEDLLSILFKIGAEMVEELIVKLENGETPVETPQDHSKETWSYKIEKKDGMIDFMSSELGTENWKLKIDRMIRAFYPWPGVWLRYNPTVIPDSDQGSSSSVIAGSETTKQSNDSSHPELASPPNWRVSGSSKLANKIIKLLPENCIQVEGKKPMTYKDFVNGFGDEGKEILARLNLI